LFVIENWWQIHHRIVRAASAGEIR